MPYKDKEQKREWQRKHNAEVRKSWLAENGPCQECGSEIKLELHHKDPKKKVSHKIWSWSVEKREKELEKCIVLCEECHDNKRVKPIVHGTVAGYHKCNCEACKKAHREYNAQWKAACSLKI